MNVQSADRSLLVCFKKSTNREIEDLQCNVANKITIFLVFNYFGLYQVRDAALKLDTSLPKTDVNREYYLQNIDREVANQQEAGVVAPAGALGKLTTQKSELLSKLARTAPYYKRNRPHICSFWVKGECKRGEECPYR